MMMNPYPISVASDEQLWLKAREGDRDAFGVVVERYQSLICSLAYSACGSISRSEDLAQETFVTAWLSLNDLREPQKLRAWLCGIVRNLSANAARKESRRGTPAESIETLVEVPSSDADPSALAVNAEESRLLWRSLGALPDTYREPLVLFYRQGQSITEVALGLDLSEDAVKQRLSRGRALLRKELALVVESCLARTRPGSAFTLGVLVALPMASASATAAVAIGSAASQGMSAVSRGVLAKLGFGAVAGPLVGLAIAYLGTKAATSTGRSPEERAYIRRCALGITAFCVVASLILALVLSQAGKLYTPSAALLIGGIATWTSLLVGGIMMACRRMDHQVGRIRAATNTTDAPRCVR